eukprot:GILJ01004054.1.p1 GENE.GILJ01004054.1~~GILJ01004054.1.p1  ORF type:complete len:678 (-),score=108.73 GILJ01004054.1:317-2350(-)
MDRIADFAKNEYNKEGEEKDEKTISVLVVEDERTCRKLVERRLRSHRFKVTSVESAMHAVDLIDQGNNYDLILIDVNLPNGLNGFDLLRHVRIRERGLAKIKQIPVIMMSGENDPELPVKCFDDGADDFLPKPISSLLERKIILYVSQRRKELSEMEILQTKIDQMSAEMEQRRSVNDSYKHEIESLKSQYVKLWRHFNQQQSTLFSAEAGRKMLLSESLQHGHLPLLYVSDRGPLVSVGANALPLQEEVEIARVKELFRAGAEKAKGSSVAPDPSAWSLDVDEFLPITTEVCGFPEVFNVPLFEIIDTNHAQNVTCDAFLSFWAQNIAGRDVVTCFFNVTRYRRMLSSGTSPQGAATSPIVNKTVGRSTAVGTPNLAPRLSKHSSPDPGQPLPEAVVVAEDLRVWLSELVSAPDVVQLFLTYNELPMIDQYVDTVLLYLCLKVSRGGQDKLGLREFHKSYLINALLSAVLRPNIQLILSYEKWRAIRMRFLALDKDRDGLIDAQDLLTSGFCTAVCPLLLDRVFAQTVRKFSCSEPDCMNLVDFFWFTFCEEERQFESAQLVWFRCVDVEDKGFITKHDIKVFYDAKVDALEHCGIEYHKSFADFFSELIDVIAPEIADRISLKDIRKSKSIDYFCLALFTLHNNTLEQPDITVPQSEIKQQNTTFIFSTPLTAAN